LIFIYSGLRAEQVIAREEQWKCKEQSRRGPGQTWQPYCSAIAGPGSSHTTWRLRLVGHEEKNERKFAKPFIRCYWQDFIGHCLRLISYTKSSIFWDITPCNPLKVRWRCRRNMSPPSSSRRISLEATCSPKCRLTFVGLHGIVSQETEFFISTGMRTTDVKYSSHLVPADGYDIYFYIVTGIPIARWRLGKHIPAEANSCNNRTSIVRQSISKQAFSTIERLCFPRGPCRRVSNGQRRSFELVVENWVEFWRWQSKVIEMEWQETN
jgi:hypothetical protein